MFTRQFAITHRYVPFFGDSFAKRRILRILTTAKGCGSSLLKGYFARRCRPRLYIPSQGVRKATFEGHCRGFCKTDCSIRDAFVSASRETIKERCSPLLATRYRAAYPTGWGPRKSVNTRSLGRREQRAQRRKK